MNKVSWSWLGGFAQAEGSIGRFRLTLSQKEREPLELAREFLMSETSAVTFPKVFKEKGRDIYKFVVDGMKWLGLFRCLGPYLRVEKRERLLRVFGSFDESCFGVLPFDEDWVVGFWEGDGSVGFPGSGATILFAQKNVDVLKEVSSFMQDRFGLLGRLTCGKSGVNGILMSRLAYHCSVHNSVVLSWLLENVRGGLRREQLRGAWAVVTVAASLRGVV